MVIQRIPVELSSIGMIRNEYIRGNSLDIKCREAKLVILTCTGTVDMLGDGCWTAEKVCGCGKAGHTEGLWKHEADDLLWCDHKRSS